MGYSKRINQKEKTQTTTIPTSFLHDTKYTNNPTEIANNFNEFFSNIGPNLAKQFDKHSSIILNNI